jgi:hypothetical protein
MGAGGPNVEFEIAGMASPFAIFVFTRNLLANNFKKTSAH